MQSVDWLLAVLLGCLQGITEFLPVSSSGHLIIFPWLVKMESAVATGLTFTVAVHVGTGVASVGVMWREWQRLFVSAFSSDVEARMDARLKLGAVVAGTGFVAIVGLALESSIEASLREPWIVGLALAVGGIVLYLADRIGRIKPPEGRSVGIWFVIACSQVGALVPGVSRSGLAMMVGRSLGLGRAEAAKFSFLLMAPVVVGAAVLRGAHLAASGTTQDELGILALGAVVSGLTGFFAARWLLQHVHERGFAIFAVYRLVVGIGVLGLFLVQS